MFVSVLCAGRLAVAVTGAEWTVHTGETNLRFRLTSSGGFDQIEAMPAVDSAVELRP
jgi:hypothetical protein